MLRLTRKSWLTSLRVITQLFGVFALSSVFLSLSAFAQLDQTLRVRKQYNLVSARIDSLVRAMETTEADALDTSKLPEPDDALALPSDVQVMAIFWADDEAKVWINDHFVGETRLTPVEVVVPNLYLKSDNIVRVRGWDTDYVESGFLFGLYVKKADMLHPILVSDESWEGTAGPVESITYAHSMPDIPKAEVIWSQQTFGMVEMSKRFGSGAIRDAGTAAGERRFSGAESREMSLHAFVAELAVLETERERLREDLRSRATSLTVPQYSGQSEGSLTLGKAGPLQEFSTKPVSEQVKQWAETLQPEQQTLVYPDRRRLRGEGAATEGGVLAAASGDGERNQSYQPPSDRRNREPGSQEGQHGAAGGGGGDGGADGQVSASGGGFGGRASRLGLLIPTLILASYAVYATREWRRLSREAA